MSTTDGGTTWQMDVLDDYPDETELRALNFIESGHGWATGVSGLTLKTHFPVYIETTYTDYDLNIFPNPFTTSTTLSYTLEKPENVQIILYNLQGQIVERFEMEQPNGPQQIQWNAEGLPAGLYIIRLQAGNIIAFSKLLLAH